MLSLIPVALSGGHLTVTVTRQTFVATEVVTVSTVKTDIAILSRPLAAGIKGLG